MTEQTPTAAFNAQSFMDGANADYINNSLRDTQPTPRFTPLVNARYAKNVPGRKTNVSDAGWLRQLHS